MLSIPEIETVVTTCAESHCDLFEREHVMPAGMSPALHEIRLEYVELTRTDEAGERWQAWLIQPEAEYGVDELAQLQADVTKALAMLRDLNAA